MKTAIAFLLFSTVFSASGQFAVCVDSGIVSDDAIVDASGMASSRLQDGVVWVCNGHSDHSRIHALDAHGRGIAAFYLKKTIHRNWEDMASGPGPDPAKTYLYVGDIGDNDAQWATKTVYRFAEPPAVGKGDSAIDTIKEFDKLEFAYPDSVRDAEALMVDPLTKDYYIISKREDNVRVYRAAYPQPIGSVDTLEFLDALAGISMVTAADISQSGREIMIKNYFRMYYWKRSPGESVIEAMRRPSNLKIPYLYQREPVGEAMCWSRNADGYFTLSEEKDSVDCRLYYYARTNSANALFYPAVSEAEHTGGYRLDRTADRGLRLCGKSSGFNLTGRIIRSSPTAAQPLIRPASEKARAPGRSGSEIGHGK